MEAKFWGEKSDEVSRQINGLNRQNGGLDVKVFLH